MRRLQERQHSVFVTSRDKDVTLDLLDEWGIDHICLGKAGSNLFRTATELATRNLRLIRVLRKFRPDIIAAKEGVFAAQAGRLSGTRSVCFDDTDTATLQKAIYARFAWSMHTDENYRLLNHPRHKTFRGISPLAYLHPRHFRARPGVLESAGIPTDRPLIFCRFVAWNASHDIGHSGINRGRFIQAVRELQSLGHVVISSESRLPTELASMRLEAHPADVHSILSHASLYVGESLTMASEAAVLGVPPIRISTQSTWFSDELEARNLQHIASNIDDAVVTARRLLNSTDTQSQHCKQLGTYLASVDDLSTVIVEAIESAEKRSQAA